jgi:hypothetical protein
MLNLIRHEQTTIATGGAADLAALLDPTNVPEINRGELANDLARVGSPESRIDYGGLASAAEAARIFTDAGWQDGADRARREIPTLGLSDLAPEASARKRRRAFAEDGDTLRVDAALAGNWDRAYETRQKRASRMPVAVSVGCAFGGNANLSHAEMFWNGLQMAALCDLLEGAGWRAELRALKANDFGRGRIHVQDWVVKQADQPLRLDTTLALFGHAGVYRTFGWAGNKATEFKTPSNGGDVLTGEALARAIRNVSSVIPPLSLILPQAYSRSAAITNLRAALRTVATLSHGVAA